MSILYQLEMEKSPYSKIAFPVVWIAEVLSLRHFPLMPMEAVLHILKVWILPAYLKEKYLDQLCFKLSIQINSDLCSLAMFHLHVEHQHHSVISEKSWKDSFTNVSGVWSERASEAQLSTHELMTQIQS